MTPWARAHLDTLFARVEQILAIHGDSTDEEAEDFRPFVCPYSNGKKHPHSHLEKSSTHWANIEAFLKRGLCQFGRALTQKQASGVA